MSSIFKKANDLFRKIRFQFFIHNTKKLEYFGNVALTKSIGTSRTGKVRISCSPLFKLNFLEIDSDWLKQNSQNPSDEFLWSIENAVHDAIGAVIYEHEEVIRNHYNNDFDRLLNQLKSERTSRMRLGDQKQDEEGNYLGE